MSYIGSIHEIFLYRIYIGTNCLCITEKGAHKENWPIGEGQFPLDLYGVNVYHTLEINGPESACRLN
jgi:hypothetical protein